jgi:hypothetical protein
MKDTGTVMEHDKVKSKVFPITTDGSKLHNYTVLDPYGNPIS